MKKEAVKDQYNNEAPDDLVVLPNPAFLTEDEAGMVMDADWYEVNGVLCASARDIGYTSEHDLLDAGVDVESPHLEVLYVASILKRIEYDPDCPDNSRFYTA